MPEKGIRYLVEAFKNVKTEKKLVIAGGSSDTDSFMKELKELAKGDKRILFTGICSRGRCWMNCTATPISTHSRPIWKECL